MANNSDDSDYLKHDEDFQTIVVDGAYTHPQDGFVSLFFYRDTLFPKRNNEKPHPDKFALPGRELKFEVRISHRAARILSSEITRAIDNYKALRIFSPEKEVRIWTGGKDQEPNMMVDLTQSESESLDTAKKVAVASFNQMLTTMQGQASKDLMRLYENMVFEYSEEIQEIANKYGWEHPSPLGTR